MLRKIVLTALLFLVLCSPYACAAPIEKRQIRALDPYMALFIQFLGGAFVESKSYAVWDAKDQLKLDRKLIQADQESFPPLLALNRAQYDRFLRDYRREGRRFPWISAPLGEVRRENVHFVYEAQEVKVGDVWAFYGEPSNLPFTVQKVMVLLNELWPDKYSFFQRRLGEFDARLRSTLLSGRKLLAGRRILDFGGTYREYLKAAGCAISQPTAEEMDRFLALADTKDLKTAKLLREEIWKDDRIYVMDHNVSPRVKAALMDKPGAIYISPPRENDDPLLFLHRLVLILGSAPTAKGG